MQNLRLFNQSKLKMKQEIKIIECNTMAEAEAKYYSLRAEGCWQMVSSLKLKWSWRKMRTVAVFKMKRVEKPYHFDNYISDIIDAVVFGIETFKSISSTINNIKRRKQNGYAQDEQISK